MSKATNNCNVDEQLESAAEAFIKEAMKNNLTVDEINDLILATRKKLNYRIKYLPRSIHEETAEEKDFRKKVTRFVKSSLFKVHEKHRVEDAIYIEIFCMGYRLYKESESISEKQLRNHLSVPVFKLNKALRSLCPSYHSDEILYFPNGRKARLGYETQILIILNQILHQN